MYLVFHEQEKQDDDILSKIYRPHPKESSCFVGGFCKKLSDKPGHADTGDAVRGNPEIMDAPKTMAGRNSDMRESSAFIGDNRRIGKVIKDLFE